MKKLLLTAAAVAFAAVANTAPVSAAQYGTPAASTGTGHWEWQYHYVGHHPRYVGYWAWVR